MLADPEQRDVPDHDHLVVAGPGDHSDDLRGIVAGCVVASCPKGTAALVQQNRNRACVDVRSDHVAPAVAVQVGDRDRDRTLSGGVALPCFIHRSDLDPDLFLSLERALNALRVRPLDHIHPDLLLAPASKGDSEADHEEDGKNIDPKNHLRLTKKLLGPGHHQLFKRPVLHHRASVSRSA